jgi:hypothetical protein
MQHTMDGPLPSMPPVTTDYNTLTTTESELSSVNHRHDINFDPDLGLAPSGGRRTLRICASLFV